MEEIEGDYENRLENKEVSVGLAFRNLNMVCSKRIASKYVLVGCKIKNVHKGNKRWEIELSFFRLQTKAHKYVLSEAITGYFACHSLGDFVAYSIHLDGHESWFDSFDLALNSLKPDSLLQGV